MTADLVAPGRRMLSAGFDALREQLAPGAPDDDFVLFAKVCDRLDLDPFRGEIALVGRYDKRANRQVYRHQVTVAGRRVLAVRTGDLVGIEGPVWCGPRDNRGQLVWQEVWDDDDHVPYCARVLVHRRGWVAPVNGTAKWSEFAQTDKDGVPLQLWRRMPSLMLGKCAESLALRRGFPDAITADVVDGFDPDDPDLPELGEASVPPVVQESPPPAGRVDVDAEGGITLPPKPHGAGWHPTVDDQGEAHRIVGALTGRDRAEFLDRHGIGDFGQEWPPDAVTDALHLGRPFQ